MLERVRECSEQRRDQDLPGRDQDEPDDPGDEAVISGGIKSYPGRPEGERNEYVDEKIASGRRNCQGRHRDEQEASRGVEGG